MKIIKWIPEQISSISSLRTDEHYTWVNIFITCLGTNALLLIALFNSGSLPEKIPGIIICTFGFTISLIYIRIQNRALVTMKGYEKALKKAHKALALYDSTLYIKKAKYLGARTVMTIFTVIQMVAWFAGIIFFINNK